MQTKDLLGLALILFALLGGIGLTCFSQRMRDVAFFCMTAGLVVTDRMDINFFSREWYRGTTRGIEISLVDILAVCLIISAVLVPRFRPRIYWPAGLGLMLLLFGYACVSVYMATPKIFGIFELSKMLRAMLFFVAAALFVRSDRELRLLVLALCCTVCLQGAMAAKHKFVLHLERATGTLEHANSLSMYMCMAAPILVVAFNSSFPKWLRGFVLIALGASALGIVLSLSRAGMPIFGLVVACAMLLTMSWKVTAPKVALASVTALVFGGVALVMWDPIVQRYSEDSIEAEMQGRGFESRGQYFAIAGAIVKERQFGVGLNNWSYWVSKTYGRSAGVDSYQDYDAIPKAILEAPEIYDLAPNYAPPAHNLGVLTLGEMGWPGLILFALLWLRWFQMGMIFLWQRSPEPIRRMGIGFFFAVLGVFLQSLTEWVYRQTPILLTLHIVLGSLASLYYIKRHTKPARTPEAEMDQEPVRASYREPAHVASVAATAPRLIASPTG
jgi:hypothetical protein